MEVEEKYNMLLTPGGFDGQSAKKPANPDRWIDGVRRLLRRIEGTKIGPMLLADIRNHNSWVSVEPYENRPCNPAAFARRTVKDGRLFRSTVRISPEHIADGTPCAMRHRGGAVVEDHEILFHELVHTLRHVSQKWSGTDRLGGGLRGHNNFEEFVAILMTNIYASANGKTALRAGHAGHSTMRHDLADSFSFFEISTQAFPLINQFDTDHPQLSARLKEVEAPFNPISAFGKDVDRVRRLSEGAKAKGRDAAGDMFLLLEKLPFSPIRPATSAEQWMPR